jgi:hypothetical protein
MNRFTIVAAALSLLLAACAAGTGDPDETGASPTDNGRPDLETPDVTMPGGDGGLNGDITQEMINSLLEQAADETGIPIGEISVVTAEAVTWSDGSLGCPEPGMGYTQALVPGYRVVLDVDGEEIHYHAGSDGQFFACENPQPPTDDR